MQFALNIPDDVAAQIMSGGVDISRAALEALAIEGYRSERLSESDLRRMLGFETRMQVHAFLKGHGVYLHYSLSDLERDRESAMRTKAMRSASAKNERTSE